MQSHTCKKDKKTKSSSAKQQQKCSSLVSYLPRASQLENYKAFFQHLLTGDDMDINNEGELANESE